MRSAEVKQLYAGKRVIKRPQGGKGKLLFHGCWNGVVATILCKTLFFRIAIWPFAIAYVWWVRERERERGREVCLQFALFFVLPFPKLVSVVCYNYTTVSSAGSCFSAPTSGASLFFPHVMTKTTRTAISTAAPTATPMAAFSADVRSSSLSLVASEVQV